jgi:quinol monooxygenase YgiN
MRSLVLTSFLALGLAAAAPQALAGGVRMFVRHDVNDYSAWRQVYDEFNATRSKLGTTAQAVYRSVDNPNDVTVTHDFKTMDQAKALAASPELKAAMEKAGVAGPPQIWFTTKAGGRSAEAAGVRMYVRHEVAEYAAWRKAYDGFAKTRRKMGVIGQAVYRSDEKPNDITVTHDFKTADEAKALAASPELKAAMEKAGVAGAPQIWFTTRAAK